MRYYIYPVFEQEKLRAVVLMAHPMDIIQQSLSQLLLTLEVIFIVFLIPTALGGYVLARSGMQPIAAINEKLRKISSENLEERIGNPKTGDEIEELAHTFNSLLNRLHQAFIRERQFIGDVAHELKTPLSTFRSSIEVSLSKERTVSQYKKVLAETLIDIDRLTATVKNILDLAWSEAQVAKSNNVILDLSKLVEDLKDFAEKMAYKKRIEVKGNIDPDIKVFGIKDKLERAFLNILDNAVKYTPELGKIDINLSKTKNKAVFEVEDNGTGIDKADLPYIFQRFYRGSKTDKSLGSGLGLSISQAIINFHRGKIEVKSLKGRGTSIRVILPRATGVLKEN